MSTAVNYDFVQPAERRSPVRLTGDGTTDCGRVREINEDAFHLDPVLGLVVVADGVGGGERGDIASRMAVEEVLQRFDQHLRSTEKSGAEQVGLIDGIVAANKAINRLFSTGRTATTVVAGAFVNGGVHIAHVGDSRAFRLRQGELEQLTEDHSLVNVYLRAGVMTPEQAKTFRLRNVLTRGVGNREDVEVDSQFHTHEPGDRYLFCTDGVTDLLDPEEITSVLARFHSDDALASEAVCDAAWEAGGHDNITAVVVRPADPVR